MKLFYRDVGSGFPVVILHGLYGSSDNWVSIAKLLSGRYRLILVDHRNHGGSPHGESHTYNDLVGDLFELVRALNLPEFHLMGHSMGGKVAMLFQALHPDCVKSLIVVDITPWNYSVQNSHYIEHCTIIEGMLSLPLESLKSRPEADKHLALTITSGRLRQFLLKSLRRSLSGQFYWSLNLPVLKNSLAEMLKGIDFDAVAAQRIKVLFIKGVESDYLPENQVECILGVYPNAKVVRINNAGHWVHAEQPVVFANEVLKFLESS